MLKRHDIMADTAPPGQQIFRRQHKTFPMFPAPEDKSLADDYGEPIRYEDFLRVDGVIVTSSLVTPPAGAGAGVGASVAAPMAVDDVQAPPLQPAAIPYKYFVNPVTVNIECAVHYLDFEGRSDREGLSQILSIVKPHQVILVHGGAADTARMLEHLQGGAETGVGKATAPRLGEVVNVTLDTHIHKARLKDSLLSSLEFAQVQEHELAWLDGVVTMESAAEDAVPVIDVAPGSKSVGHRSVFVGELRLNDFKQVLSRANIDTVFMGGVLVCDDVVAVRRDSGGAFLLEGPVCDVYYRVRDLLYQQFAIV